MIKITDYNNKCVRFYCTNCDKEDVFNASKVLGDNCAIDLLVSCSRCKDSKAVYLLMCDNPALAKELNAQLEVLRIKREGGDLNGCQDNRPNENSPVQGECC